jgi:hypothetical protein
VAYQVDAAEVEHMALLVWERQEHREVMVEMVLQKEGVLPIQVEVVAVWAATVLTQIPRTAVAEQEEQV